MINVTIDASDVVALFERMRNADGLKRGLSAAAVYLRGKLAQYPSARPQAFQWVSEKQRRFVMAAIRSGDIRVPYARGGQGSQTLGKRWAVADEAGGLTKVIGNNAGYAKWVQGGSTQAFYHRGNWKTNEDVARDESGRVRDMIADEIAKDL